MSKTHVFLFAVLFFYPVPTNSYAEQGSVRAYKDGELLVRFAPRGKGLQVTSAERETVLTAIGIGRVKRNFKKVPGLSLIKLPESITVADAVKQFRRSQGIVYAEPNYKIYLLSTFPNDMDFSNLWGLHNTDQTGGTEDADIDAPEAWDIHTGSQDITVAVLDSGIDHNHPDLAANMWINQAELNGDPNYDDDGNDYKDDVYGYDFADYDSDPNDYYFHGTHVAGTIGAVGNNNTGVVGVCWNVKIMDVKIFPNYGEETFIDRAIEGIHYAVDNGAKVLNNSWGGGEMSLFLKDAIEDAGDAGVLFIAAAGNYPQTSPANNDIGAFYPSSYDLASIIAVMSTDHNDNMSTFSHYGATSVDLAAPGSAILSTFPTYETPAMEYFGLSTYYETISRTAI